MIEILEISKILSNKAKFRWQASREKVHLEAGNRETERERRERRERREKVHVAKHSDWSRDHSTRSSRHVVYTLSQGFAFCFTFLGSFPGFGGDFIQLGRISSMTFIYLCV
jgi:hypothetical protein